MNNRQYRNTRLFRTETLAEELGLLAQESQLLAKQLKFDEPDSDKSIIFDERKALKRATSLKIVEKLTAETYQCMYKIVKEAVFIDERITPFFLAVDLKIMYYNSYLYQYRCCHSFESIFQHISNIPLP